MRVKLTACGTSHLQRWTNQNHVILAKYQWNHFTNILISYTLFQQVYSSGGFFFKVEFCIGFSGKWQKAVKWQIEGMGIYHTATHTRTMALNCRHAGTMGEDWKENLPSLGMCPSTQITLEEIESTFECIWDMCESCFHPSVGGYKRYQTPPNNLP